MGIRRRRLRYGPRRQQVADLWLPEAASSGRPPVVVLVHGGYWQAPFTRRLMRPLAADLAGRGYAAYNVEYRRVGLGGGGGGWPATMDDVATAVDRLVDEPEVDASRVVLVGHSAGGQLVLWVAGRHRLPLGHLGSEAAGRPVAVGLRGVVAVAGVVDLDAATRGGGRGPVEQLVGADPERRRAASPIELLPIGVAQLLVHGTADTTVPLAMSEAYAAAASAAGDVVVLEQVAGAGHRDVLSPRSRSWAAVVARLPGWLVHP
jgi:acetyl esterase/lipase